MPEHILIGWLVMIRLQPEGSAIMVPEAVTEEAERRGWMEDGEFTDAGTAITDMNAPEWGIDPIECDHDAT